MPRDSQRRRLYRSEGLSGLKRTRDFKTIEECEAFVREVEAHPVFLWELERNAPGSRARAAEAFAAGTLEEPRPRPICVYKTRRDSGTAYARYWSIHLPPWAYSRFVILHELAHVITKRGAAHGPEFAGTLLELVDTFLGAETGHALRESFSKQGVSWEV